MTYMIRQEVEIQGLRHTEFEARRVLRSQGYPSRYSILGYWQSFEAADAAARGQELRDWFDQSPQPAWATATRPTEAYEQVHQVLGNGAEGTVPGAVGLIDWTLNFSAANWDAFAASRKEMYEFQKEQNPGFLRHRLLRFLGGGGRYLVINAWTSDEASGAPLRGQAAELIAKYPASKYASIPFVVAMHRPVRVPVTA